MNLADISLFLEIARSGSLTSAGRGTGLSPMAVSRRLSALETQVGARLFHRTTRALSLTAEGEAFLPHARLLISARDAALAATAPGGGLTGTLKVTAPNVIGHSIVVPVLAEMLAEHPRLAVDLTLSDAMVDIAGGGLDLAVRVSPMSSSNLIATRLASNPRVLCAAPHYLMRAGRPIELGDLAGHSCITLRGSDAWPYLVDGDVRRMPVKGRFCANSVDAVREACLKGAGIAQMTYWDVAPLLRDGHLESIELIDADPEDLGIWAVYPSRDRLPARVTALIAALRRTFGADQAVRLGGEVLRGGGTAGR